MTGGPEAPQYHTMKITRDTPDQLILENKPWVIGALMIFMFVVFTGAGLMAIASGEILFGALFALLGGGVSAGCFAAFVRRTMVIFDRPGGTINLRRKGVFGMTDVTHELRHLDRAVVQTSHSTDSDGHSSTTHRCAIILNGGMSAGTHPLTLVYSSGSGADRAADAINRWLRQG